MKKRLLIVIAILVGVAAGVVFLDPGCRVMGWMRGDSFYRGKPTTYWSRALRDSDPATQVAAHKALETGGSEALPVLTELLHWGRATPAAEDAEIRWRAARMLGSVGAPAVPALIEALNDPDGQVRIVVIATLGKIPEAAREVVPVLVAQLSSEQRLEATKALSNFHGAAREAVPSLEKLLKDPAAEVRKNAANTLGKIGPGAVAAAPALVKALTDKDAYVREHAAEALGEIGPSASAAVPALIAVLEDPNSRVRRDAVRSLGQMGPAAASARSAIRPLLKDDSTPVRQAAAQALRKVAPPGEEKSSAMK